jgi:hypothetical protein
MWTASLHHHIHAHGQWLRERGHSVIVIVNDTVWIPGKPVLMFSLELKKFAP